MPLQEVSKLRGYAHLSSLQGRAKGVRLGEGLAAVDMGLHRVVGLANPEGPSVDKAANPRPIPELIVLPRNIRIPNTKNNIFGREALFYALDGCVGAASGCNSSDSVCTAKWGHCM